jgi:hypothetical protein
MKLSRRAPPLQGAAWSTSSNRKKPKKDRNPPGTQSAPLRF